MNETTFVKEKEPKVQGNNGRYGWTFEDEVASLYPLPTGAINRCLLGNYES